MGYLRNCWYMAGWAEELAEGRILARRLLDIPVALFRDRQGVVKAVQDRCPHRFAPLSMGMVSDGALICGYHGLAFAGDGKCVANPHGPIVSALRVDIYPVREAFRAIWIWFGDPSLADNVALPELGFLDEAKETAFSNGYLRGEGNYQLYVDNILDLTHTDFLHPTTLGGGAVTRTRAEVSQDGNGVSIQWHPTNETPSPLQASLFNSPGERVDSWTEVMWMPPATMMLVSGAVPTGTPRSAGGNVRNVHIMTPENADTTHYFFASTRDFAVDDAAVNERVAKLRNHIFSTEDGPMITALNARMEGAEFWSLKPVLLPIDKGAVLVRRTLERLIAAEQESTMRVTDSPLSEIHVS